MKLNYAGTTTYQKPPRQRLRGMVDGSFGRKVPSYYPPEEHTEYLWKSEKGEPITVTSAYASLYANEKDGKTAITYFLRELGGKKLYPVDLWQSGGDTSYCDSVLDWTRGQTPLTLLVNPLSGPESDIKPRQHIAVRRINDTAAQIGKQAVHAKIAEPLYSFDFTEQIAHAERQGLIIWDYFDAGAKLKEKLHQNRLDDAALRSFAQGLCEIMKPQPSFGVCFVGVDRTPKRPAWTGLV